MCNPFVVLMIGIYLGGLILEDDATIVDQLYFSFISMSTIGCGLARFLISYCLRAPSLPPACALPVPPRPLPFSIEGARTPADVASTTTRMTRALRLRSYGDISPTTPYTKLLTMVFLPVAVAVLAQAIADVQSISLRKAIRQTDYGQELAGQFLAAECIRNEDSDDSVTEAEFLVMVLLRRRIVVRCFPSRGAVEPNHHHRPCAAAVTRRHAAPPSVSATNRRTR